MDALSELLRLARFGANVALDATAHEPWCVSVAGSDAFARAHVVLDGECHLRIAGADDVTLRSGDMVLLPGGDPHLVGSPLDTEAKSFASVVRQPLAGELVPVRLGGSGAGTRWISLTFSCERHLAQPLLEAMPRIVFVDLAGAPPLEWLTDELGLVLSASDAPFVGAAATRARLAELVLIEALGRYVQGQPPGGRGWLAGLNDRFVGRTLALVHGRPSEPWTVERLGRQVGLSRSALAERFGDVMGEPIFEYLTRWRLQLAAEFLLAADRPVQAIAKEAGYESASAFARAFKAAFGKAPTAWRARQRRRSR
jgi:AraC family transcriptional regulator, alkane utilization regulator